ncbi:MAG: hypothetical protein KBG48_32625 [Kofleriaceae bacterium]|jgi:hypothetical protein|nr:hypothetical protein [Kofleriaceae bacterium]MBP9172182.1 hypothetical protein [Kofleriaceae bacterium]MBP9858502.1 hypothetical protein [Kofleriaceae bacterium]
MSGSILARLQGGLEATYRVATGLPVDAFMLDEAGRASLGLARAPREQLVVVESDDGLDFGLFVDDAVLAQLAARDPADGLDDRNLPAFLYAVEGVSHFIYAALCAQRARTVSALELELQAEVDKYVTCLLSGDPGPAASAAWRRRLYDACSFEPDLDADERDRYRVANDNARRYAGALERRYVARGRIADMLVELRRFYRLPIAGKLDAIARAA